MDCWTYISQYANKSNNTCQKKCTFSLCIYTYRSLFKMFPQHSFYCLPTKLLSYQHVSLRFGSSKFPSLMSVGDKEHKPGYLLLVSNWAEIVWNLSWFTYIISSAIQKLALQLLWKQVNSWTARSCSYITDDP